MSWKPTPAQLLRAIDLYVQRAYDGPPPSAVRSRIDTLRSLPERELYDSPVLEPDAARPPTRYSVRLGNRFYPHMKLVITRSPDARGHLFRADTHDAHCRPQESSREMKAFLELVQSNQSIAQQIEQAWAHAGLPTFKTYLRDDVKRRKREMG